MSEISGAVNQNLSAIRIVSKFGTDYDGPIVLRAIRQPPIKSGFLENGSDSVKGFPIRT
jgi:hypothetical protein